MGDSDRKGKTFFVSTDTFLLRKKKSSRQKHTTIHGKLYIVNKLPDRALYT